MGRFSWLIGNLSWQIDISGRKNAGIHIIINGFLREHDFGRIGNADMVYGLPLFKQRGNEAVQLKRFCFLQTDAGSGFGADRFVFLLCGGSGIKMFFQGAFMPVRTAVADIGRFQEGWAVLLKIVRAVEMAFRAGGTFFEMAGRIGAEPGKGAAGPVGTVIERTAEAAGLPENEMAADLFGNGSAVPA